MSYAMAYRGYGQAAPAPAPDPGTTTYVSTDSSTGGEVVAVIGILALVGIVGFLIYESMMTERQIVHEQGVGKALEFEGGKAAIGVLTQAFSKNKRRRRARRRR